MKEEEKRTLLEEMQQYADSYHDKSRELAEAGDEVGEMYQVGKRAGMERAMELVREMDDE